MAKRDFTPQQKAAIETKGNVIVSASAGSGKTTVMVERIARLLSEGHHLKNMLICTYTRAATLDMRQKIHEKISVIAKTNSSVMNEADYLPIADICTLDSWCRAICRTYFFAAGFDPAAEVYDSTETKALLNAVADEIINIIYDYDDANTVKLLKIFSDRAELRRMICDSVLFALSTPDPFAYLDQSPPSRDKLIADLYANLYVERDEIVQELGLLECDITALNSRKLDKVKIAVVQLKSDLRAIVDKTLVTNPTEQERYLNERYKALKEIIKKYHAKLDKLDEVVKFDSTPVTLAFKNAVKLVIDRYQSAKRELNILDYSDLERGALKALTDETAGADIRRRYKFLFVDEFQDINPLQNALCESLMQSAETFLVGDIKQSIYRFRHCDPKFFMRACERDGFTRVNLNANFRSKPPILDFVNGIFKFVMKKETGGVDYAQEGMLYSGLFTNDNEPCVKFDIVEQDTKNTDKQRGIYSVRNAESMEVIDPQVSLAVEAILDYIAEKNGDGKRRFGDIAVLTESRGLFTKRLISELNIRSIPTAVCGKFTPTLDDDLKPLLSILRAVDNRFDDYALAGALLSPAIGLNCEQLLSLSKGESFSDTALADERLTTFIEKLNRYRQASRALSASELIAYVVSDLKYFDYLLERGCEKPAKLETLIKYAENSYANEFLGGFLSALDEKEPELEVSSNADAVSIMTIHAAKGLEFPFVIFANTSKQFNNDSITGNIILSDEFGITMKAADFDNLRLVDEPSYMAARASEGENEYFQRLRLLYVALTRARDRLYIIGSAKNQPVEYNGNANCALDIIRPFAPARFVPKSECILPKQPEIRKVFAKPDKKITDAITKRLEFVYPYKSGAAKTCVTALAREYNAPDSDETDLIPDIIFPEYFDQAAFVAASVNAKSDTSAADNAIDTAIDGAANVKTDLATNIKGDAVVGGAANVKADLATNIKGDAVVGGAAKVDPLIRGTAYHAAMERVNFSCPNESDFSGIDGIEYVDFNKIFAAAKAMNELCANADMVLREQPFIIDMRLHNDNDLGGTLVQGIIDLLIVRGKSAVIVDYKTGLLTHLDSESYYAQLVLYKKAVESILGYSVTDMYLYSLDYGVLKRVDSNK